jgi:phosphoglycerol transferase MdoB-like AlkP superfamily enzyme
VSDHKDKFVILVLLQAWAALEYLDGAVGKIFDYLRSSGLDKSTYVMLLSDNGSGLLPGENKRVRHFHQWACQCMKTMEVHVGVQLISVG